MRAQSLPKFRKVVPIGLPQQAAQLGRYQRVAWQIIPQEPAQKCGDAHRRRDSRAQEQTQTVYDHGYLSAKKTRAKRQSEFL